MDQSYPESCDYLNKISKKFFSDLPLTPKAEDDKLLILTGQYVEPASILPFLQMASVGQLMENKYHHICKNSCKVIEEDILADFVETIES